MDILIDSSRDPHTMIHPPRHLSMSPTRASALSGGSAKALIHTSVSEEPLGSMYDSESAPPATRQATRVSSVHSPSSSPSQQQQQQQQPSHNSSGSQERCMFLKVLYHERFKIFLYLCILVICTVALIVTVLSQLDHNDTVMHFTSIHNEQDLARQWATRVSLIIGPVSAVSYGMRGFMLASIRTLPSLSESAKQRVTGQDFGNSFTVVARHFTDYLPFEVVVISAPGGAVAQTYPAIPVLTYYDMMTDTPGHDAVKQEEDDNNNSDDTATTQRTPSSASWQQVGSASTAVTASASSNEAAADAFASASSETVVQGEASFPNSATFADAQPETPYETIERGKIYLSGPRWTTFGNRIRPLCMMSVRIPVYNTSEEAMHSVDNFWGFVNILVNSRSILRHLAVPGMNITYVPTPVYHRRSSALRNNETTTTAAATTKMTTTETTKTSYNSPSVQHPVDVIVVNPIDTPSLDREQCHNRSRAYCNSNNKLIRSWNSMCKECMHANYDCNLGDVDYLWYSKNDEPHSLQVIFATVPYQFGNNTNINDPETILRPYDPVYNEDDLMRFIQEGQTYVVYHTTPVWYVTVRQRESKSKFLTSRVIATVIVTFTLGAVALLFAGVFGYFISTRVYDGNLYAPKSTPFAILSIGPVHADDLWGMVPVPMAAVMDKFNKLFDRQLHNHHACRIVQMHPYTNSCVTRTVAAAIEMAMDLLTEMQRKPIDAALRELLSEEEGRLMMCCGIHWCTRASVSAAVNRGEGPRYDGEDVLFAARMWVHTLPNHVTISAAAEPYARAMARVRVQHSHDVFVRGEPMKQSLYTVTDASNKHLQSAAHTARLTLQREYDAYMQTAHEQQQQQQQHQQQQKQQQQSNLTDTQDQIAQPHPSAPSGITAFTHCSNSHVITTTSSNVTYDNAAAFPHLFPSDAEDESSCSMSHYTNPFEKSVHLVGSPLMDSPDGKGSSHYTTGSLSTVMMQYSPHNNDRRRNSSNSSSMHPYAMSSDYPLCVLSDGDAGGSRSHSSPPSSVQTRSMTRIGVAEASRPWSKSQVTTGKDVVVVDDGRRGVMEGKREEVVALASTRSSSSRSSSSYEDEDHQNVEYNNDDDDHDNNMNNTNHHHTHSRETKHVHTLRCHDGAMVNSSNKEYSNQKLNRLTQFHHTCHAEGSTGGPDKPHTQHTNEASFSCSHDSSSSLVRCRSFPGYYHYNPNHSSHRSEHGHHSMSLSPDSHMAKVDDGCGETSAASRCKQIHTAHAKLCVSRAHGSATASATASTAVCVGRGVVHTVRATRQHPLGPVQMREERMDEEVSSPVRELGASFTAPRRRTSRSNSNSNSSGCGGDGVHMGDKCKPVMCVNPLSRANSPEWAKKKASALGGLAESERSHVQCTSETGSNNHDNNRDRNSSHNDNKDDAMCSSANRNDACANETLFVQNMTLPITAYPVAAASSSCAPSLSGAGVALPLCVPAPVSNVPHLLSYHPLTPVMTPPTAAQASTPPDEQPIVPNDEILSSAPEPRRRKRYMPLARDRKRAAATGTQAALHTNAADSFNCLPAALAAVLAHRVGGMHDICAAAAAAATGGVGHTPLQRAAAALTTTAAAAAATATAPPPPTTTTRTAMGQMTTTRTGSPVATMHENGGRAMRYTPPLTPQRSSMSALDIRPLQTTAWTDCNLRRAFEHQAIVLDVSYDTVKMVVQYFYMSILFLVRPLGLRERNNLYHRLRMAFGVPQQHILEHLAARCTIVYIQQQEQLRARSWTC